MRTVVLMLTATCVLATLGVTGLGETEQLASRGSPVQLTAIGCENPPVVDSWSANLADWPAEMVALGGSTEIAKSDACPKPLPVSKTI